MADKRTPRLIQKACPCCGYARVVINGQWLRERREARKISLRNFAMTLGFSAAYISDIELGHRGCTPKIQEAYEAL